MLKDDELDTLFDAARAREAGAQDAFLARVLGDAAEVAATRGAAATPTPQAPSAGFWQSLVEGIGGWRGGMALTAAALAGVYIGLADPAGVDTLSGLVSSLAGEVTAEEASLYDLLLEV